MHLVLSFAVTLALLAGQVCGGGVGSFYPLAPTEEGERMSRWVSRCVVDPESAVDTRAQTDCASDKCVENIKKDQYDVGLVDVRPDVPCPPAGANAYAHQTVRIAFHEPHNLSVRSYASRSVVRIE